jgi:hypothetical protein
VRSLQSVPRFSQGCRLLGTDNGPNRLFLCSLFNDHSMAIEFLKDIGFLRKAMRCGSCEGDMTWSAHPILSDGFAWRCNRRVAGVKCGHMASIRRGSWFQRSRLTLLEILLITYDIVCREPAHRIQYEYGIDSNTIADWGMFCREAMLAFLEGSSVKRPLDGQYYCAIFHIAQ